MKQKVAHYDGADRELAAVVELAGPYEKLDNRVPSGPMYPEEVRAAKREHRRRTGRRGKRRD
jgi:hypothetical protein